MVAIALLARLKGKVIVVIMAQCANSSNQTQTLHNFQNKNSQLNSQNLQNTKNHQQQKINNFLKTQKILHKTMHSKNTQKFTAK